MPGAERFVTPEMKSLIGTTFTGEPDYIERNDVRFFAEAIRHPNSPLPQYVDEVYARSTHVGGLIAPPTYLTRLARRGGFPWAPPLPPWLLELAGVNAGVEVEAILPLRVGDVVSTEARVLDIYERMGRKGRLVFIVVEYVFTNQLGQYVGKTRRTTIKFPERPY